MKKWMLIPIFGTLLFVTLVNANSVDDAILKDQAKIDKKQQELNSDMEEAKIKYSNKPSKLAEKDIKFKDKQQKIDIEKKELEYRKDNMDLLKDIENKRYQIHLEKIKSKPDWNKIEELTKERNFLEEKFNKNKP